MKKFLAIALLSSLVSLSLNASESDNKKDKDTLSTSVTRNISENPAFKIALSLVGYNASKLAKPTFDRNFVVENATLAGLLVAGNSQFVKDSIGNSSPIKTVWSNPFVQFAVYCGLNVLVRKALDKVPFVTTLLNPVAAPVVTSAAKPAVK